MIKSEFQRLAARISAFSAISYAIAYSSQLIDIFWVSRLGAGAPTAIAVVSAIFLIVLTLNEVIGVSSVALLSQSMGTGNKDRTATLILNALCLKLVFGLGMACVFMLLISYGSHWYTDDPEIRVYVLRYSRVIWLSLVLVPVGATALTVLRIIGSEKHTAVIAIAALVINAALTPWLIFGGLGVNALGIAGAAWATVITEFSVMAVAIVLVACNHVGLKLSFNSMHWEPALYRDFLFIGLPIAGVVLLMNLERAFITAIVSQHSVEVSDGFAIGLRIFGFYGMGIFGVSLGAAVAVGRTIGAGRFGTIQSELSRFALLAGLTTLVLYSPVLIFAHEIISFFSSNPRSIATGALYLQVMGLVIVVYSVYYVYNGAFEGAGRNRPLLLVAIVVFIGVEFPLLFLIANYSSGKLIFIWWVMLLAAICNAACTWYLFRLGHWRTTVQCLSEAETT